MNKRPTLRDIAQRAGVSVSAVSYALKDGGNFPLAADTKNRIREIAREVGYVPNSLARSLKQRSSRTLGAIVDKPISNPRYAAIAQGLARGAADERFDLLLLAERDYAAAVDAVRGGQLDGIVFIGHDDHEVPTELADLVARHGVPFGAIDCGGSHAYTSVDFDYGQGVDLVVDALAAGGVNAIEYVRPLLSSRAEQTREDAMVAAARRRGIALRIVHTPTTVETLAAYEADDNLASYRTSVTAAVSGALDDAHEAAAFVCSWGADVEYVYAAARARDPRIRVAGLARGTMDPALWPGLSYAVLPLVESGRAAASAVIAVARDGAKPTRIVLSPSLVD